MQGDSFCLHFHAAVMQGATQSLERRQLLARSSALVFKFALPEDDKFGITYATIRNTGFAKVVHNYRRRCVLVSACLSCTKTLART
jgi:hypothetical protein